MNAAIYGELRRALDEDRVVALATVIEGPGFGRQMVVGSDGSTFGDLGDPRLGTAVAEAARESLARQTTARVRCPASAGEAELFVEPHMPPPRLVVVGAVHVAVPLVHFARILGLRTIVIDPRSAFAAAGRFSHADRLIVDWPEAALREVGLNETSYVAVLAHDPKIDLPALAFALRSPARYVGALGSRRTHAGRVEALRQAGLSEEEIARVRAPIGLDLGGRRPEEIAVAVIAEIVAAASGRQIPTRSQ